MAEAKTYEVSMMQQTNYSTQRTPIHLIQAHPVTEPVVPLQDAQHQLELQEHQTSIIIKKAKLKL